MHRGEHGAAGANSLQVERVDTALGNPGPVRQFGALVIGKVHSKEVGVLVEAVADGVVADIGRQGDGGLGGIASGAGCG